MVRKKSKPVRNVHNNTLEILTARVEREERERAQEEEEMNTTICLAVPSNRDLGQRGAGRRVREACDKELSSKRNLENHARIHTGEKPFKCRECDKTFTVKSDLKVHFRTRARVQPYERLCGKAFKQSGHLSYHKRTRSH